MDCGLTVIAHIHTEFPEKFGIPRQSGLVPELTGEIVFEPAYRAAEALRGIEDFSHLWLIWGFSAFHSEKEWSPTVRPPRLGGNKRMGVFATRSPNRPNPLGLSSVKLCGIRKTTDRGTVLLVSGADLMDGTPIYDIKPYLAFTDSHPQAKGGFADAVTGEKLKVILPASLCANLSDETRTALTKILADDPRPSYQEDNKREYGFTFKDMAIRFTVNGDCLTVKSIDFPDTIGYNTSD